MVNPVRRKKKKTNEFFQDGVLKHHVFAKYLIENYNIIRIDGVVHMYGNGYYTADSIEIKEIMIQKVPELTRTHRNEVYDYLSLKAPKKERDMNYISFENWLYNIDTHQLVEHDPSVITTNKIPININLDAYSKVVDITLNKITCNDKQIRALLEEMIGYMFLPNNKYQKCFILFRNGGNGKSTFLNMVKALFGKQNYTSLALQELDERFSRAELLNKMVNFGDDIPKKFVRDSSTFKKIVTGDEIKAEEKGKKPFMFKPYAKLLFTCNEMVTFDDNSHGLYRRLVHIPFNASISPNDEDYDPLIDDKLQTEESLQYLFILAMEGLKRLVKNKRFTEPAVVKEAEEEFKKNNNHVLEFVEEHPPHEKTLDEMYSDYCFWIAENGYSEKLRLNKRELSKNIKNSLNMELRSVRKKGENSPSKVFKHVTENGHIINFGHASNP